MTGYIAPLEVKYIRGTQTFDGENLQNDTKESKEPHKKLFLLRLENIINMDHELVRLADKINWDVFAKKLGEVYIPNEGRPWLPTRLMAGLHYLKGLNDLLDEKVNGRIP